MLAARRVVLSLEVDLALPAGLGSETEELVGGAVDLILSAHLRLFFDSWNFLLATF